MGAKPRALIDIKMGKRDTGNFTRRRKGKASVEKPSIGNHAHYLGDGCNHATSPESKIKIK